MTTPLQTAAYLHALGATPIVLPYGQKKPALAGWQNTPMPAAGSLPVLFGRERCNVGVLLGAPSAGLVDVDLDCAEAVEMAPRFLPPTLTFGRPSKRRSHMLYRADPIISTMQFRDGKEAMLVELRSTGAQTLAPGSINPEDGGELVTWEEGGEGSITRLDGCALRRRVVLLSAASLLARHCGPDAAAGIAGALSRSNWPRRDVDSFTEACMLGEVTGARPGEPWTGVPERVAERVARWLNIDGPQRVERTAPVAERPGTGDVMARARAYVARVPAAIEGEGGNSRTFKLAIALVRGFELDRDQALALLHEYNRRAKPPWTEAELLQKLDCAERSTVERGYLLRVPRRDGRAA